MLTLLVLRFGAILFFFWLFAIKTAASQLRFIPFVVLGLHQALFAICLLVVCPPLSVASLVSGIYVYTYIYIYLI